MRADFNPGWFRLIVSDTPVELSPEEIDHVLAVIDVCLDEGYDIRGVDETVLKAAREKLLASR